MGVQSVESVNVCSIDENYPAISGSWLDEIDVGVQE